VTIVRQLPQWNLYFELREAAATEEPCIVSVVGQQQQRNLYCEFCETAATGEPLL
jgi:hypothetical protein